MIDSALNRSLWKKKAVGFVTRSHRHLWGKNNEDPLAFLFTRGLKNEFSKKVVLGWNKFGQSRPPGNWGLAEKAGEDEKLFLPPGIVVPYIIEKELLSVFIYLYREYPNSGKTVQIPGNAEPTIILGKAGRQILFVRDLVDGLFLQQELGETYRIVIHPCPDVSIDKKHLVTMEQSDRLRILSSGRKEDLQNREVFKNFQGVRFCSYASIQEFTSKGLPV